ncbi:hypothetical protein J4Q44_G00085250 [Coregonus suidteri]|uniref:Uncharacterized protein n=1 Tax=Coregonus suidteri TaxID=861788 RepID=A0AAN8M3Z4_9TELE
MKTVPTCIKLHEYRLQRALVLSFCSQRSAVQTATPPNLPLLEKVLLIPAEKTQVNDDEETSKCKKH